MVALRHLPVNSMDNGANDPAVTALVHEIWGQEPQPGLAGFFEPGPVLVTVLHSRRGVEDHGGRHRRFLAGQGPRHHAGFSMTGRGLGRMSSSLSHASRSG